MRFSDYIVFVDESGDHGMANIDPAFPLFVLSCCLISKRDYMAAVVPAIQRIKFATFGHDAWCCTNARYAGISARFRCCVIAKRNRHLSMR